MELNLKNKTALITGASTGIGAVFAKELAKRGCHVILVARSEKKLADLAEELEKEHNIRAIPITSDLTDPAAPTKLVNELSERKVSIDLLVNNAGSGTMDFFDKINYDRILNEIQLNITSMTALTHLILKEMVKKNSGTIINVASLTAFQPTPFMSVYGATKAYVLSFTEALSAEYSDKGIQFLALCPGETDSSFHKRSGANELDSKRMMPIDVVNAAFKALEKEKHYKIVGRLNYIMGQLPRFFTRKVVLNIAKGTFQSGMSKKETQT